MAKLSAMLGGPQGMLNFGANLMAGSGPSPVRQNFGSILGQGLLANQQFKQQSEQDALQALLVKSQIERNKERSSQGAAPSKVQEYEYAKANGFKGSFEEWMRVASAQQQSPAGIQEYEYFTKLPPDQQKQFLALQRSPVVPQLAVINGVPTLVDRTNATQTPLTTQEAELDAARKKATTESAATASGRITGEREGKAPTAYAAYRAGVASLEKAMSGTMTNPVAGRLPAMTAAQQTAEGAEATMAPILKDLFRSSGEGTFTEGDQALLLKMVPTRKDHQEARKAKLEMIDEIVRAKLGITDTAAAPAAPAAGNIDALLDRYAPR